MLSLSLRQRRIFMANLVSFGEVLLRSCLWSEKPVVSLYVSYVVGVGMDVIGLLVGNWIVPVAVAVFI